jgi:DNA-binding NarL/FixJ family response regulator
MTIRLLHCDDSDAMRLLVREQFAGDERVEVVGGANDPESAVRGAADTQPDVVLLDLLDPVNAERLVSCAAPRPARGSSSTAATRPRPRASATAGRTATSRSRRRSRPSGAPCSPTNAFRS